MGENGTDKLYGGDNNDRLRGGWGADYLSGGNGNDWASYLNSTLSVVVDLVTGTGWGGTAAGDTLYSIENVRGGSANDVLFGNSQANGLRGEGGNDSLEGGAGSDTLDGGTGADEASYAGSSAGVFVSLITDAASGGHAAGDELNSIEDITGSDFDDELWGSLGANWLKGGEGNDTLKGFGGGDTLWGGNGIDTISYAADLTGVYVDLLVGIGGGVAPDKLNGIEYAIGTAYDDTLYGTGASNLLKGEADNDTIGGRGGNDILRGGDGIDKVAGEDGGDIVDGGEGNDWLSGGIGNDTMVGGGAGADDTFVFYTALNASTNVDTITDFMSADDTMRLDNAVFVGLTQGAYLSADQFHVGSAAADAEDRVIYNQATGALLFDSDGVGGAAAIKFAQLTGSPALSYTDFYITLILGPMTPHRLTADAGYLWSCR